MANGRFSNEGEDVTALLDILDLDGVADIETLLMILFQRDLSVEVIEDEDGDVVVEVVFWTGKVGHVCQAPFPLSAMALVGACVETVSQLDFDARTEDSGGYEERAVMDMSDEELGAALEQCLGKVRIFNMIYVDA